MSTVVEHFITPKDMVVSSSKKDGITAGGFKIDNLLMSTGSPYTTVNIKKGGGVMSGLKGLAVPAGLVFIQRTMDNNIEYHNKDTDIEDNLFEKLVELASSSSSKPDKKVNKRSTRKDKKQQSRKTRRKK
tara:strand:+ start:1552 stop:1941 length:390 start_codon:yes stop_codon:yes gene_type:complete